MLFYIDGNNVGNWREKGRRHISQDVILTLLVTLKRLGHDFVCYFDASVHNQITKDQNETNYIRCLFHYEEYIKNEQYRIVTPGSRADEFILPEADNDDASIISNDKYKQYEDVFHFVKNGVTPQRLFRGKFQNSTVKGERLIVSNLFNVSIEKDIPKLLSELGIDIKIYKPSFPKPIDSPKPPPKKPQEPIKPQPHQKPVEPIKPLPLPTQNKETDYTNLLIAVVILLVIVVFIKLNSSDGDSQDTADTETSSNREPSYQEQSNYSVSNENDCQSAMGTVRFKNTTSRTIYVSLAASGSLEAIEIKPHKEYSKDLEASDEEYNYTYHYYATPHKDSPTGFKIQSCKTKTITLNLPEVKYYSILFNVWTEITFPEPGVYRIFVADGEFYYKYENDDKINSGFTHYIQRVQKGDKIYFATSNPQGEELGIAIEAKQSSSEEIAEVPKLQEDTKPKESKPTGHVYEHQIEDISVVEPSMVTKLTGTIGELQVACDLTINPDKTVECDCNPGTYFDPTIYFRGNVAKNGALHLGHYVNGAASDYVTLKLKSGCYVGKSIGVNGLYFIRLCP